MEELKKIMETDEVFKKLPNFINIDGEIYFFHLVKGNNRIIVFYRTSENRGGKHLDNTHKGGKTLNDALNSMYNWLITFGYINESI